MEAFDFRIALQKGVVIPAHPLALDENRRFDERSQRALTRYYIAAGAGGVAVGVHTTQFAIREPKFGLYRPVLELAAEEVTRASARIVKVAGICGRVEQATAEATLAQELGFDAGLVSLASYPTDHEDTLIEHCRAVGEIIPIFGFYLQPAAGGRLLSHAFWRRFAEIEQVVAIKMAPFNRYQTIDVIRGVLESGRRDIALYTGNDDNIVGDLLTEFSFGRSKALRVVGGLLGHWAVGTRRAVELLDRCRGAANSELLRVGVHVTDANAAYFDAANHYRGCIPGILEVLRRQGLVRTNLCLDERETLSPGQLAEIDRVSSAYPDLTDDDFIAEHREDWLR